VNIVVLAPELFRHDGGIARLLRLYVQALAGLAGPDGRLDVVVLNDAATADPRLADHLGGRAGECFGADRSRGRFIRRTLRLARRADLLVCGHLHQLPVAWLAARLNPRLKYCLVAHGIEVWRPYGALERRALRGATRILCVSDFTRRQLRRFLPDLRPERLVVVPNAPDPRLASDPARAATTDLSALPRILSVGRLDQADAYKGFDTLIEAMPAIRRSFPTARLRLIGQGDDQPRLMALAERQGVRGCVDFLGAVDDATLRAEYGACDLFALPSRREGFGLVYAEAMSHGKPCLAARAGGAPEVVNDDVGALVEYGDVAAIAAAVTDLVRHPRAVNAIRSHAASYALPHFQDRLAAALS
jgi:phosphatidylinositol alpha-1,6-mannosyltransferase